MENIISDLKEIIKRRNVTEQWISVQTGIPQTTVHRLISGQNKNLDLTKIRKIQDVLGATPEPGGDHLRTAINAELDRLTRTQLADVLSYLVSKNEK